jgi:hypothetical protein
MRFFRKLSADSLLHEWFIGGAALLQPSHPFMQAVAGLAGDFDDLHAGMNFASIFFRGIHVKRNIGEQINLTQDE